MKKYIMQINFKKLIIIIIIILIIILIIIIIYFASICLFLGRIIGKAMNS